MGATPSKSPDWYPGEPERLCDECVCSQPATAYVETTTANSAERVAGATKNHERGRKITNLPVVELTDMKFVANGAYCAVFTCKFRGHNVVAKRVRADLPLRGRQVALANLWTEYDCLRPLCHPNVIDVYGLWCRKGYEDWNEKDVCLLLERLALGTVGHLFGTIYTVDKNLASHLAKSRLMKLLPFRSRLNRALELALALEYLHEGSGMGAIMHRDLKSVNVGFSQDGTLKLLDFGLSKSLPLNAENVNEDVYQMTGEVGSYRYMAPEIVKHEPYNTKADIYSWAILSWEMLAIEKPYAGVTESTFIRSVAVGGDRPTLNTAWPEHLCQILASAWHPDHRERPAASQIVVALRRTIAQLPARRRSFGRRPSATAGDRRHSWAAGPVASGTSTDAAAEQHPRPIVRSKRISVFVPCSGDNGDNGEKDGDRASNGNGDGASRGDSGSGGGDVLPPIAGPAKRPSDSKPQKRFSFSALLPSLVRSPSSASSTSSSSSSSKRKSWYKVSKTSSSTPAAVSEDLGYNDSKKGDDNYSFADKASNPKPAERSSIATTRHSSVSMLGGSILIGVDVDIDDNNRDIDSARQGAMPMSGAIPPLGGNGGTSRCPLHQDLFAYKEEISNKLAAEAMAQMLPPPSPVRVRFAPKVLAVGVQKTRGEGLVTLEKAGAKIGESDTGRDPQPDNSTDVDASEHSVDVSARSNRRSGSAKKLWPSHQVHDNVGPVAAAAAVDTAAEAAAAQRTRVVEATPGSNGGVDHGARSANGIMTGVFAVALPALG